MGSSLCMGYHPPPWVPMNRHLGFPPLGGVGVGAISPGVRFFVEISKKCPDGVF